MHLPHVEQTQAAGSGNEGYAVQSSSIWSYKHTVLGALGIFFYVGVEVGLASIAVDYFKTQGMSTAATASYLVSLYWFGALVGRLLGAGIMTKVKAGKLLGIFGFTGHKQSFFGDLHCMGRDGFIFYTETKNVTSTWLTGKTIPAKVSTWDGTMTRG